MAGVCNGNKLLPCSHLLNFIFVVLLLLIGNVLPYIVQLGSPTSLPATESRLTTHTHSVAAQLATVWSIWTSVYGFPATHFVMHCFLLNVPRLRCRSAGNAGWSVWTYFFFFFFAQQSHFRYVFLAPILFALLRWSSFSMRTDFRSHVAGTGWLDSKCFPAPLSF